MSGLRRVVVLDVPGLTAGLIERAMPALRSLAASGGLRALKPMLPALESPLQATLVTGLAPRQHGCVGDGWYSRESAEISMWRPSDALIKGERIWETGRRLDRRFSCARLFWSHGLYGTADWSVAADPGAADGLCVAPAGLREELRAAAGRFPAEGFWGPEASIESARWSAACARLIFETRRPALTLACLPQAGWALRRWGPSSPRVDAQLRAFDAVCGELVSSVRDEARVLLVSGCGFFDVDEPVALNRALRAAGLLRARAGRDGERLDAGGSEAFAVADGQVAHVYVRRPELVPALKAWLERLAGVDFVLDEEGKARLGLDHPRSGELVAVSEPARWFSYYYWLDDSAAPAFARRCEPRLKPGADPAELFCDPAAVWPAARAAWRGLARRLGGSPAAPAVPLEASLVRGANGRAATGPFVLSTEPGLLPDRPVSPHEFKSLALRHVFEGRLEEAAR